MELLIVSFFLWVVLDPICVLTSTKNIDPGYESEGRYVVRLSMYEQTHGNYDAEAEDTTVKAATVPEAKSNFNIIKYRDAVVYKMKLPEVPEGKRVAMAEFRSTAYADNHY